MVTLVVKEKDYVKQSMAGLRFTARWTASEVEGSRQNEGKNTREYLFKNMSKRGIKENAEGCT